MSTTTKVQRIIRKNSEQWYVTLPASIAQTMGFAPESFSEFASAFPTSTNPSKAAPFLAEALFRAA